MTAPSPPRHPLLPDLALASLLAALLVACWAINDWAQVGRLNLPDTDDMMRLAQVRDWIAGQAFDDWTQYRLAPPFGAPMHWSRINDLGIAALIIGATPVLGRHAAEVFAVIAYPAILFAAAMTLSARIARHLWGPAAAFVAIVLMALAYPANAMFLPGRIDHHALQIVCTLATVLALLRPPTGRRGALAGLFVAISLGIGLETVPQLAAIVAALVVRWAVDGAPERMRLAGLAGALAAVTALLLLVARPTLWTPVYCDTFTPASTSATLLGAAALLALAAATPWLRDWRWRLGTAAAAGALVLLVTLLAYPTCLTGPYGQMDPFLQRAMIDNISEARGLFRQSSPGEALAGGGLLLFGCLAALWLAIRDRARWRTLLPIVLPIATSALLTLVQIRGAYVGAALVAPMLAGLVLAARGSGRPIALVAAWVASAGQAYQFTGSKLPATGQRSATLTAGPPARACRKGDVWQQLDRYPPGTTMSAIDTAAYILGGTHHGAVGAGYHRNDRGNRAMYAFFLSPPPRAHAIATRWRVAYVVHCPTDFAELDVVHRYPASLAAALARGRRPDWLEPLPLRDTGMGFYRVR